MRDGEREKLTSCKSQTEEDGREKEKKKRRRRRRLKTARWREARYHTGPKRRPAEQRQQIRDAANLDVTYNKAQTGKGHSVDGQQPAARDKDATDPELLIGPASVTVTPATAVSELKERASVDRAAR
ncbi:hypothetical protein H112_02448 [Trichophyton rubrum D6]|uniref:Uncharacterized protein n=2 Tax=Trichophyton TaxID=5550 RepID=A0A022W938_TRIRU|nr:hypothetical protein H100_02449 [Trichophyton rubrum MR850]EZF44233.1 hypothetical protein H102_02445 [Trichophyton rubrum CBS 100081]EZF54877.1 hypothetical protein H103_02458 [Trichophyton rubrum CBS 288.86]EZF65478.1 hypothetical protein H104_02433 [Trichophyton rubrum CBS 289.86]EZF76122.1 hypothetical protein H105_02466 [Trichophyton soudanense CBS 452.61]EZF86814.1 hypothetical protein H110_02452 [Trichophyton rubrum MR1448]EZF97581.1 hypothetical protein H113_02462 [Trichophyton rub